MHLCSNWFVRSFLRRIETTKGTLRPNITGSSQSLSFLTLPSSRDELYSAKNKSACKLSSKSPYASCIFDWKITNYFFNIWNGIIQDVFLN